jgi:hypothetical protein
MENLNTTFFSLRSINNDGQIRRSRFARSTVSSKTFERAHKPVVRVLRDRSPGDRASMSFGVMLSDDAGPVAQLARAHP